MLFTHQDMFKMRQQESYNLAIMSAVKYLQTGKSITIVSPSKEDTQMMAEMIRRAQRLETIAATRL